MSEIDVPDDLLSQVDFEGLINEFREKFKRLDDFRKTREAYGKRGAGQKLFDALTFDSTLEEAELEAVETQADFSKAIGQLMVVSLVQSQQLLKQQEELSAQQGIIKDQAQRIERQAMELQEQQGVLAEQNAEIKKLIKDSFELRGLTMEGAKRLIEIASEVQGTRDSLLSSVEASLGTASTQLDQALEQVALQMTSLKSYVHEGVSDNEKQCGEMSSELRAHKEESSKQLADCRAIASSCQNAMQAKVRSLSIALGLTAASLVGSVVFFASRI